MWFDAGSVPAPPTAGASSSLTANAWCIYEGALCKVEGIYMDASARARAGAGEQATHVRIWDRFAAGAVVSPSGSVVVEARHVHATQSAVVSLCRNLPPATFPTIGVKFSGGESWTVDDLCRVVGLAGRKIYVSMPPNTIDGDARAMLQSELRAENPERVQRGDFASGSLLVLVINEHIAKGVPPL